MTAEDDYKKYSELIRMTTKDDIKKYRDRRYEEMANDPSYPPQTEEQKLRRELPIIPANSDWFRSHQPKREPTHWDKVTDINVLLDYFVAVNREYRIVEDEQGKKRLERVK